MSTTLKDVVCGMKITQNTKFYTSYNKPEEYTTPEEMACTSCAPLTYTDTTLKYLPKCLF